MTTEITELTTLPGVGECYGHSYYFIAGAGGDVSEWVKGYEGLLEEQGIGKPKAWFKTTGATVNLFASHGGYVIADRDMFPLDLTILMFSLEGLDLGKLAMFKIRMEDRWFDDVIDNMRRRSL